jgi:hypothetical protein
MMLMETQLRVRTDVVEEIVEVLAGCVQTNESFASIDGVDGPTSAASKCQGGRRRAIKEEDRL